MFMNRSFLPRVAALILCCMLGHTGCFDVLGFGDAITFAKQPDAATETVAPSDKPAAFTKSISVINPPKKLQVDKPHQLLAIISDSNDARILDATTIWESSDPAIVTIDDDGKATAHRPGKAFISANFARLSDRFMIETVDEVPHTITFDKNEIEADELDEFTLVATVQNRFEEKLDIPVKLTAENSRLIRFRKDGTIFARSPGVTQVHATAGDLKESIKVRIEPIESAAYKLKAAKLIPLTPEEKAAEEALAAEAVAAADAAAAALANPKAAAKR